MPQTKHSKRQLTFSRYFTGAFLLTAALAVLISAFAIVVVLEMNHVGYNIGNDISLALVVAAAVSIIVSCLIGLALSNTIVKPVNKITSAARRIKEGDLSARTGLAGDDELAQLGESFDEMAEVLQRDRDLERQLIGDVAHELRTPIMAIQATVEAIQDGVFPADEQRMGTLSAETRRLGRLVDGLLRLNRLENGVTELHIQLLNLTEVIEEIVMTHEALVESVGLTLYSKVDRNVIVEADRDLVKQAVTNLLSNAVRYTPEGGTITLSLERDGDVARVSVRDTGIGIAEEDLPSVFSRFWRADDARASGTGGLGIGLSLVREVAEQHHGNVGVESALGEGSTFHVSLPLSESDESLQDAKTNKNARRRNVRNATKSQQRVRKEQDKQRKEQEKLAKLQQREERKKKLSTTQQLSVFGLKVPIGVKKVNEADPASEKRIQ